MNDPRTPSNAPEPDRDVLLTRIIDGRASAEEWADFRRLAHTDGAVWDELSSIQHDHDTLVRAVDAVLAEAEVAELPDPGETHRIGGVGRWPTWLGWAAAACVALAWLGSRGPAVGVPAEDAGRSQTAGLNPASGLLDPAGARDAGVMGDNLVQIDHPQHALDAYLTRGQDAGLVLGELDNRPLIRTSRLSDGQVEVIWVRQIVERSVLPETYRRATDEFGNPVAVPVPVRRTNYSGTVH